MHPICYVFDTEPGPNVLPEDLSKPDWLSSIRLCHSPRLEHATNQKVKVVETIVLLVQIGESRICVLFGIVRKLVVPALLSMSFTNKVSNGISPGERKIVLFNSSPVPIIVVHETEADETKE